MPYTNETKGPVEIVQDAEGLYRWTYELDSRENNSFLKLYLLIFALIILIPGAILFFMIFPFLRVLIGRTTVRIGLFMDLIIAHSIRSVKRFSPEERRRPAEVLAIREKLC